MSNPVIATPRKHPMNSQQIFDKSVTHMLTQGHQSSDDENCRYRSDAGACGIGCLFPDSAYRPEFDRGNNSVRHLLVQSQHFRAALESQGIDILNIKTINLLEDLQNIHDRTSNDYFMADVKQGAFRIAKEFDLVYNPERTQ